MATARLRSQYSSLQHVSKGRVGFGGLGCEYFVIVVTAEEAILKDNRHVSILLNLSDKSPFGYVLLAGV